jgi:glycosyltransferase involved in cell wall biosynthesis
MTNSGEIMKSDKTLAIILPAYNEALTIENVLRSFHAVAPHAGLFVVDNNSTDDTASVAEKTLAELKAQGAVLSERRQGKGNAVRRAFMEVDADIYVMVDADDTYSAASLRDIVQPILDGRADMVNGDRRSNGDYGTENKRLFHNFGNRLVQKLVHMVSGTTIVDIMSGYRAMNRHFVQCYPILVDGFQLETDMCLFAAQARLRVVEVDISYKDRPDGSFSKLNTISDGLKVLWSIFNVFRHCSPFLFFAIFSCFFFILSISCGSIVVSEWLATGLISHIPLTILSVALGLFGVVLFSIGIFLDTINYQNRREIEFIIKSRTIPKFVVKAGADSSVSACAR